jgi:hypothetical protein
VCCIDIMRGISHTSCQAIGGSDYNDVLMDLVKSVVYESLSSVEFESRWLKLMSEWI